MSPQKTSAPKATLVLFVNGQKMEVTNPDPEMTLLEYLRRKRLTGSKLGCGEGGCGACTVMVSKYNSTDDVIDLHGLAVTTVEGIGNVRGKLHPVQRQIAESHGSQCGFCTPGIVMSMYALLRNHPHPTQEQIHEAFDGNLCRCTGYRPIIEGFQAFTKNGCPMGDNCCQRNGQLQNGTINGDAEINGHESTPPLYDPTQEPIFPPELKLQSAQLGQQILCFQSDRVEWLSPPSLSELLTIRRAHPDAKLLCGNSEIGIEVKFKKLVYPVVVSVSRVPELQQFKATDRGIQVGACLSLAKVDAVLKKAVKELPEYKTRVFSALIEMFKWFAGRQIRSVACMAGNIMTASPISDLNPLLLACKAVLEVVDAGLKYDKSRPCKLDEAEVNKCLCTVVNKNGVRREVQMNEDFFTNYRQTCLGQTDTLLSVTLPFTKKNEYFYGYKQANRKEDDIATVNAGMRVDLGDNGTHVSDITLAFGGMSTKSVLATKTMAALKGRRWDETLLQAACSQDLLPADLPLPPGSPGGTVAYRRTLTLSFFFRFYTTVSAKLQQNKAESNSSAISDIPRGLSTGSQVYQMPSDRQSPRDAVGRPIIHQSAYKQATGEAVYVDDVPLTDGELFAGFVTSTQSLAKIVRVDATGALQMPGVVGFFSAKDVPGNNAWDWDGGFDVAFAEDKAEHEGQVIGMVVADTLTNAQRAANQVKVEYETMKPVITIQDAIEASSYYPCNQAIQRGDVQEGLARADHVIEGQIHLEAQEHFYLEPHSCIVYPRDTDEYHVICMGQALDSIQVAVAKVLGIPANQVNISVRRIGGGFGGKESRHSSVVVPVAVAASKLQRPVRAVLERDEDLRLTGTRHPVLAKYKVGFSRGGQLQALQMAVYFNCGMSKDLSVCVSERCMLTLGNAYKCPNVHITSNLCRTNIASCTAFRGFGTPQGVIIFEHIIDHVATTLQLPPEKVRQLNFFKAGDTTLYGQVIEQCNLLPCWEECSRQSDYHSKLQSVREYNRSNRWKKRGVALVPLTYGIGFPPLVLNKGIAVVNVYADGSVLLLPGGVEMGQGLHTKMIQLASRVLDIPVSYIRVPDASSNATPNTAPTAGSMTSDLVGMAVVNACEELKQRLEPYKASKKSWKDMVDEALADRICLSIVGYYKENKMDMDWSRPVNSPFHYFSYGAACTEVEIDTLTGDHQVLSTDIVMDVGHSINPAIDVGQIEGAFVQGYGMLVLEQYKVMSTGKLLTSGPGNYKIPSLSNIPQSFNVTLLKNKGNVKAVCSSKAIGEPPLCLAVSVFLAIKSAVTAARTEHGFTGYFQLNSPASPDKIRMACVDEFSEKFLADDEADKKKPWFVEL